MLSLMLLLSLPASLLFMWLSLMSPLIRCQCFPVVIIVVVDVVVVDVVVAVDAVVVAVAVIDVVAVVVVLFAGVVFVPYFDVFDVVFDFVVVVLAVVAFVVPVVAVVVVITAVVAFPPISFIKVPLLLSHPGLGTRQWRSYHPSTFVSDVDIYPMTSLFCEGCRVACLLFTKAVLVI